MRSRTRAANTGDSAISRPKRAAVSRSSRTGPSARTVAVRVVPQDQRPLAEELAAVKSTYTPECLVLRDPHAQAPVLNQIQRIRGLTRPDGILAISQFHLLEVVDQLERDLPRQHCESGVQPQEIADLPGPGGAAERGRGLRVTLDDRLEYAAVEPHSRSGDDARTVAVRGVPSSSAVSPNASPARSTLRETSSPSPPSPSTRADPAATT